MATLTPLGISALALLAERAMHPYEMHQLLMQRRRDRVVKVRPSSLYHAVDRLVELDFARVRCTEREGNRPERTSYEITREGHRALGEAIAEMLATPVNEYPRFALALSESHNVPRSEVLTLLRARVALLNTDLDYREATLEAVKAQGVERRYWFDVNYQMELLRAEANWLSLTITEIESGELAWLSDADCTYSHKE